MKRHIKFPLFLKDNLPVRTMEELRSNSDIPKLLTYYADGRLAIWLRDRYEDELSEEVRALDPEQENFPAKLCKLLDIAYDGSVQSNMREIISRNEKIKKIRQYTNDAEILDAPECVAFTQEEFETLCWDSTKEKIWLVGKTFELPELERKVTICGVNDPQIKVRGQCKKKMLKSHSSLVGFTLNNVDIVEETFKIAGFEWLVVSQNPYQGQEILMLITKRARTYMCHGDFNNVAVCWENSRIRSWLNHDFLYKNFNNKPSDLLIKIHGDSVTLLSEKDFVDNRSILADYPLSEVEWLRDCFGYGFSVLYQNQIINNLHKTDQDNKISYTKKCSFFSNNALRPVICIYANDLDKFLDDES